MAKPGDKDRALFTLVMTAACTAGAVAAMVVVTACLAMALYFYMETVTSPALAALTVAGGGVLLTLILALLVWALPKPSLLSMVLPSESDVFGRFAQAVEIGRNLGEEGRAILRSNLGTTTMGAIGFGLLLGISPRLRRAVFAFLRGK